MVAVVEGAMVAVVEGAMVAVVEDAMVAVVEGAMEAVVEGAMEAVVEVDAPWILGQMPEAVEVAGRMGAFQVVVVAAALPFSAYLSLVGR